jgi:hypothetical protein
LSDPPDTLAPMVGPGRSAEEPPRWRGGKEIEEGGELVV